MMNISVMGACYTIAFINTKLNNGATVWVCANEEVYNNSLSLLKEMSHINILQSGPSHFRE